MRVQIPSPLHSYTKGRPQVEATGTTLDALLADLDSRYPGLRFRIVDEQDKIRTHILVFVNGQSIRSLSQRLKPDDDVMIVAALSGG